MGNIKTKHQTGRDCLWAGQRKSGVYKIFSAKTMSGNYYVQDMPGPFGYGRRYRLMKDRKCFSVHDYEDPVRAIEAMLNELRNVLVNQPDMFRILTNKKNIDHGTV